VARTDIIFFDAGGTLIYPEPPVGEAYSAAAARHGIRAEPAVLEAGFGRAFAARKLDALPQDRAWWREIVRETMAPHGEADDFEALFTELYEHFASGAAWRIEGDAPATIRALRDRGYRTGVVSNWDDRLPDVLADLGLAPLLDPQVVSCFVGAEKPDPRVFHAALEAAEVVPERALMVGDDREADVLGARAVGMSALHYVAGAEPEADRIGRLADLLDLYPPR
jgi:putative hydrolase of the HAD superfamily